MHQRQLHPPSADSSGLKARNVLFNRLDSKFLQRGMHLTSPAFERVRQLIRKIDA